MIKPYTMKIKRPLFSVFALLTFFSLQTTFAAMHDDFVITIKSDNEGVTSATEFLIPTMGPGYNYNVDCDNDGTNEATSQTGDYTCSYTVADTYTIRIKDNSGEGTGFPRIFFALRGDRMKIISLDQWGTGIWTNMEAAFYGASNMKVPATDVPNFSIVTSMTGMFLMAGSANPDVSNWDVSAVIDMGSLFNGATSANLDVSDWDVSAVTDMNRLFSGAILSQPDIRSWDVSAVLGMEFMFDGITLPTEIYDEILVNFNNQQLQTGISFHGGDSRFCSSEAQAARENMMNSDEWTITDGGYAGENCGSVFQINSGLTGTWYYPETSGQGLMFDVMQPIEDEAGRMFVAWFTYDLIPQENNAEFGSINHRWFSVSGAYVDDTADLTIFLTENGRFDDSQTVTSVAVGQMEVRFNSCTTGIVNYSFDQPNISGSFPIQRLTPNVFCQDE